MGCGSPTVINSPYNRNSFTLNNVASELIKVFPLPSSRLLACSASTYQIIPITEGECDPETIKFEKEIYTITITHHKNGLKLIEGTCDGLIIIEDLESSKMLYLEGHQSTIVTLLMLKNGKLCSCSADGQVIIWNIYKGRDLFNFYPHEKAIWDIVELFDKRLLSVSDDDTANIVSYLNGVKMEVSFEAKKSKCALQLKDGRIVFNSNVNILIYQIEKLPDLNVPERAKGKKQFKPDFTIFDAHSSCVSCILQLNNGDLCSGGEDGVIKIWSLKYEFKNIMELSGHRRKICHIYESNDGMLISCSDDRSIRIWVE